MLLFLFNFWWLSFLIPSFFTVSNRTIEALASYNFLKATSLQEAFRFMGFWAWKTTYEGVALVPYADRYDRLPIILFTYLVPAFSFIIFLRKKSKEVVFLGILTIIGLFLTKGAQSPFGKIFIHMYNHIPGFLAFREPFSKFTLINVFSISLLLGLSFVYISDKLIFQKAKLTRHVGGAVVSGALFLCLLLLILKNAFPLLTNEAIWDKHHKVARSLFVKVPDYWQEVRNWFVANDPLDERIMVLPKSGYGHDYDWESGISTAGPVAHVLQPKPIIFYSSTPTMPSEDIIRSLYDGLAKERNNNFISGLGMLNVRYLLQHNDLDWQDQLLGLTFSPQEVVNIMSQYPEISKVKSTGRLDIYELNSSFRKPKIYSSGQIIYTQIKAAELIEKNIPLPLGDSITFEEGAITDGYRKNIVEKANNIVLAAIKNKNNQLIVISPIELNFDIYDANKLVGKINLPVGINTLPDNYKQDNLILIGTNSGNQYVPSLQYHKISPVKYEATVEPEQPFYLIFSESYDPGWKAYVNGVMVQEQQHYQANGYANSWLVSSTGSLKIEIIYSRQKWLTISLLVSVLSIVSVSGYLILIVIRNKKRLQLVS